MGKENPEGQPGSPSIEGRFIGAPTLVLHHRDCNGIGRAQHGKADCAGEVGSPAKASPQISTDWVRTCGAQVVIPASGSAPLKNQVRGALSRGNSAGCRSAWLGSSKEEFCSAYSLVCPCRRKVLSHRPASHGGSFPVPKYDRKLVATPRSCVAQQCLSQEVWGVGGAELIVPQRQSQWPCSVGKLGVQVSLT